MFRTALLTCFQSANEILTWIYSFRASIASKYKGVDASRKKPECVVLREQCKPMRNDGHVVEADCGRNNQYRFKLNTSLCSTTSTLTSLVLDHHYMPETQCVLLFGKVTAHQITATGRVGLPLDDFLRVDVTCRGASRCLVVTNPVTPLTYKSAIAPLTPPQL